MTDVAILDNIATACVTEIISKAHVFYPFHPNGMTFKSLNEKKETRQMNGSVFSVGGGAASKKDTTKAQLRNRRYELYE